MMPVANPPRDTGPIKLVVGLLGGLIVLAIAANVLHFDLRGTRSPGATPVVAPEAPWWPSDFILSPDHNIAYRWMQDSEFSCDIMPVCWGMWVQAKDGCPSGLYVEVSVMDRGGNAVGYSNDTLSALSPGQKGRLTFENTDAGGQKARLSKVSCR